MVKAAGSWGSWGLIIALMGGVALQPAGCKPSDDTGAAVSSLLLADALAGVGPAVVEPALERFVAETEALEEAVTAWSSALESGGDADAARTDAQARWRSAMAVWQELEVMQIGPAASSLTAIAGEDLRDEIYSWPTINPCRIDQETVAGSWDDAGYFTGNLVNSYGLDAIEHLLFAEADNACPSQVDINADGSWDALGEDGVAESRAAMSAVLVAEVLRQGQVLQERWREEVDLSAGDGSVYSSQQEALGAVSDALFYLDLVTREQKLGQPLGLQDCAEALCPEDVEGVESGSSIAAIQANLVGFVALFSGGEGTGLDDVLDELGHGDLSEQLLADADAALALAGDLEGPLDAAIVDRTAEVTALYDAIKEITDALKGDVATVLVLQVPAEAAGDND